MRVTCRSLCCGFFFFNDTATTEIYTLSLHDALPILQVQVTGKHVDVGDALRTRVAVSLDRKSTRLNSSHTIISYAVFCFKKTKNHIGRAHACNQVTRKPTRTHSPRAA